MIQRLRPNPENRVFSAAITGDQAMAFELVDQAADALFAVGFKAAVHLMLIVAPLADALIARARQEPGDMDPPKATIEAVEQLKYRLGDHQTLLGGKPLKLTATDVAGGRTTIVAFESLTEVV